MEKFIRICKNLKSDGMLNLFMIEEQLFFDQLVKQFNKSLK